MGTLGKRPADVIITDLHQKKKKSSLIVEGLKKSEIKPVEVVPSSSTTTTRVTEEAPKATSNSIRVSKKNKRIVFGGKRSDGLFPCKEFDTTGECKFGENCRFSHLGSDDPGMPVGVKHVRTRKRKAPCFAFQKGSCIYGKKCRYKHVLVSADEEATAKRIAEIAAGGGGICYDFRKGNCSRGEDCKFSHGGAVFTSGCDVSENGNLDPQAAKLARVMALPEKERQIARAIFFQKQRMGHHKHLNRQVKKTRLKKRGPDGKFSGACFAFQKGQCTRGDACIFQHVIDKTIREKSE